MSDGRSLKLTTRERLSRWIARIDWLLVFPIAAAAAWSFGENAVAMVLTVVLPICLLLDGRGSRRRENLLMEFASGQPLARTSIQKIVDDVLEDCARRQRSTAVMHFQIDGLHVADGDWDADSQDAIMDRLIQRMSTALRGQDAIMRTGSDGVIIVLAPTRRVDLDTIMNVVDRVQSAVAEPVSLDGRTVRVSCCAGICSEAMSPSRSGSAMLAAADCAMRIARRQGDDAVRVFTADMQARVETDHRLSIQIDDALDAGQIRPWFQPQIDARSGKLAGFEALARWHHPDLGVLAPGQFLASIHAAGRGADLGDQVLKATLEALIEWDRTGIEVPCVGVNFSLDQLMDPRLAERVIWQLDRHDIAPNRIAIEILETVTLRDGDETIMRNLRALRDAGFRLDLDDFGTGAASIAHIARFGVHRIKIDRSFVSGIDSDPAQREIVAAILGLAERLGIDTLAEGVETPEQQATLTAMGCPHLQGYGIARPMPFADTIPWALSRPIAADLSLRTMQPRGRA
ncbi:putative bifunctional diguanylate cyclase/phosphodiesterase [Jannaschia pohangensis]|uniref:Diguanylate cyclase/phosphodiesterase n=1 Tax=Jannaschia pohangensis TaxID=390807 RepID=A0A1I3LLX9_9RHOB|nr:GGDEF domain-containing phosphodiesterase [Jannaschia pohangensis]SFI85713.1 diguanylate cyclase/phosphodiesterase [Jannaschia pohangensis]